MATGIAASLYDVSDLVGTAGVVTALTCGAYLIGSVIADAAAFVHDRSVAVRLRLGYARPGGDVVRKSRVGPRGVLVRSRTRRTVANASSIACAWIPGVLSTSQIALALDVGTSAQATSRPQRELAVRSAGRGHPGRSLVSRTDVSLGPSRHTARLYRSACARHATLEELDACPHPLYSATEPRTPRGRRRGCGSEAGSTGAWRTFGGFDATRGRASESIGGEISSVSVPDLLRAPIFRVQAIAHASKPQVTILSDTLASASKRTDDRDF